jgi:uncharacterized protein YbjT (DUF2867 family)
MILFTGNNGTEIVKRLATTRVQVRAMVRNPKRASATASPYVEVVQGDFDRHGHSRRAGRLSASWTSCPSFVRR